MVGAYLVGVGSIKFGSESGSSSEDCSVSSWDEDIDSLPEYDLISARITENKGTRAKKKGVNGEYFAGRIDGFGNFIPDDIQGFTNIEVKEVDESSLSHRALCVFEGIVGQAVNDLKDLKEAVIDHPFDTAISTIRLFGDPQYSGQAAVAIGTEIYKSYEDQVVNGNQKSKDHFIGQAIFEIGTLVAGTAAGKLGKISKVGEGVEAANDISKAGKMGKVEEA
ncbi:hypothetical protein HGI39_26830, partial [Clostridium beijerinckii]|nr:hypothetical protein [Clostridium beijerinckii]